MSSSHEQQKHHLHQHRQSGRSGLTDRGGAQNHCCVHVTYQAGEGVGHAVLQSAALQNGEQGGVVEATRRRGDQLLHPLTLRRIQT